MQRNLDTPSDQIYLRHWGNAAKTVSARFGVEEVECVPRAERRDQLRESKEKCTASWRKLTDGEQLGADGRCAHRALDLCAVITRGAESGNDRPRRTHRKARLGAQRGLNSVIEICRRPELHHLCG